MVTVSVVSVVDGRQLVVDGPSQHGVVIFRQKVVDRRELRRKVHLRQTTNVVRRRQMVKCGPAGMRACSLGLVGLKFRVRDKVRVSVRDRVGVRVSDGVRFSTFYFLSH